MAGASEKRYKIRHKQSGLYSQGGAGPTWNTSGKIWSAATLKLHLCFFKDRDYESSLQGREYYQLVVKDWLVVEIEVVEKSTVEVADFYPVKG